jgi:hypothetical protein
VTLTTVVTAGVGTWFIQLVSGGGHARFMTAAGDATGAGVITGATGVTAAGVMSGGGILSIGLWWYSACETCACVGMCYLLLKSLLL